MTVEKSTTESSASAGGSAGITLDPLGAVVPDSDGGINRGSGSAGKAPGALRMSVYSPAGRSPASPSGFRRVVGFLFVFLAVYLGTMDASSWHGWVSWANGGVTKSAAKPDVDIGKTEPVTTTAQAKAEDVEKEEQPAWFRWIVVRDTAWLWLLLVAGLAAVGMLLVPASRLSYITVWALVGLVAWCVEEALGGMLPWRAVVMGAAAFGYLIHLWTRRSSMSLLGIFGLLLLVTACFGATHEWYERAWVWLGGKLGTWSTNLVADWGKELAWGTVLLLAMLGALWSRTKTIHFLSAAVLIALSYHCVMSGRVELRTFERRQDGAFSAVARSVVPSTASLDGTQYLTQEDVNISNVAAWRWVVALEMVVVACVLLYKGLGVGALNVAFALAWVFLGCELYKSMGRMSLAREIFNPLASEMQRQAKASRKAAPNPLANMGLPVNAAAEPKKNGRADVQPGPSRATSAPQSRERSTAARQVVSAEELAKARAAAMASVSQATWRELALPVWVYVTAVLAGLIAIAGLGELARTEAGRVWLACALWCGLGMALVSMWFADPKQPDQSWLAWISDWTQSRYKLYAVWLVFLTTLSIGGVWALRSGRSSDRWLGTSVTCVFVGTALSLAVVAVMTRFGGFPPMPVWMWGAVAAGQSSLAWVLMTHMNWAKRHT